MTCHEVRTSPRLILAKSRGVEAEAGKWEERLMNARLLVTAASLAMTAGMGTAYGEDLTLCWAAWDPANALVEEQGL